MPPAPSGTAKWGLSDSNKALWRGVGAKRSQCWLQLSPLASVFHFAFPCTVGVLPETDFPWRAGGRELSTTALLVSTLTEQPGWCGTGNWEAWPPASEQPGAFPAGAQHCLRRLKADLTETRARSAFLACHSAQSCQASMRGWQAGPSLPTHWLPLTVCHCFCHCWLQPDSGAERRQVASISGPGLRSLSSADVLMGGHSKHCRCKQRPPSTDCRSSPTCCCH